MKHYERRKPVRTERASFSVAGFIAERLAEHGDPKAIDFGMQRLGIDIHSSEAGRFRELLLLTYELLARRGKFVTQRQRDLHDAIAVRIINANRAHPPQIALCHCGRCAGQRSPGLISGGLEADPATTEGTCGEPFGHAL